MSLCCPCVRPWGPSLSLGAICLPTGLPTGGGHLAGSLLLLRAHVFLGMSARGPSRPGSLSHLRTHLPSLQGPCLLLALRVPGRGPWRVPGPWRSEPLCWHPLLPLPFPLRADGSPERGGGCEGSSAPPGALQGGYVLHLSPPTASPSDLGEHLLGKPARTTCPRPCPPAGAPGLHPQVQILTPPLCGPDSPGDPAPQTEGVSGMGVLVLNPGCPRKLRQGWSPALPLQPPL